MSVISVLPRSNLDVFAGMIQLPNPNTAVSEDWMRGFYGNELLEASLPISNENYQTIYNMSTDAWKGFWEHWKNEGLFN